MSLVPQPTPQVPSAVDRAKAVFQGNASKEPATQVDQAPIEESQDGPVSSKFALLARKEQALTSRIMELKKREEAVRAMEEEYKKTHIPRNRLSEDPLGVLKESGIEYDKLTEMVVAQNGDVSPEILELRTKLSKLEEENSRLSNRFDEGQTKAYEQAKTQIRNEAKALIESDPTFETIKETDNLEAVVDLIEEKFKTTGLLYTIEEAAQLVEDYLIEEALKMASLKKVKAKLSPAEEKMLAREEEAPPGSARTLTHANTSPSTRRSSEQERRERAIAAFQHNKTQR